MRASILLILVLPFTALSQSGKIQGIILDGNSGEPLIGAVVKVASLNVGAVTDLDGKYKIIVPAGTYELEYSFVSFAKKKVQNVEVKANQNTQINITLKESTDVLSEVLVEAKALKNTQSSILLLQQKSLNVMDGISSEQFALAGDNSAASAIRRVTGVSVEDGRYVYVRGLGDRYSKVSLNGSDIPGLDPNRNSVQMDLFPSALIDNIVVYKNFSPNFPGDFSGGYVNINTKDFPESRYLQVSTSLGINTQTHFNSQRLTHTGGRWDFLGIDDGTRARPSEVADGIPTLVDAFGSDVAAQGLTDATKAFNKNIDVEQATAPLNQRLSVAFGDSKELWGKTLGFVAGVSYQRNHQFYGNGKTGRYQLSDHEDNTNLLNPNLLLDDKKGETNVLWGGILNTGIKLNDRNKISINALYNNSGNQITRYQEGKKPEDDNDLFYQTRALLFENRQILSGQLKGSHAFLGKSAVKLGWASSYSISKMEQPDFRFFTNGYRIVNGKRKYEIEPSIGQIPSRYWRNMSENNWDTKVHLTIPITNLNSLKVGVSATFKDRVFREYQYRYEQAGETFDGNPTNYVSDANIWTRSKSFGGKGGVYITDAYQAENNFDASQKVLSAYAMIDFSIAEDMKLTTGLRIEKTDIRFTSLSEDINYKDLKDKQLINNLDWLPALNLQYRLREETNLRLAYGRTLARPTFRELAPLASFDFIGDFLLIGNPDLKRTLIDNLDIRLEKFFKGGEMYSLSLFYKHFTNPIEKSYNPEAVNAELVFRNVEEAYLLGIELEVKKNLKAIHSALNRFFIGLNATYINSRVNIAPSELENIRSTRPSQGKTRQMFGQSPYIINTYLNYRSLKGTVANLSFNVQGPRLAVVITGGTPNVQEQPFPSLNFSLTQPLGEKWRLRFRLKNLLDSQRLFSQTFKGKEYAFQSFTQGRNFSIGVRYALEY